MLFWRKAKVIQEASEPFEVKRRRELLVEINHLDLALASIHGDIGEERRRCGLSSFVELPTSLKSPRMQALQLGLIQLSNWHSQALKEHANLV